MRVITMFESEDGNKFDDVGNCILYEQSEKLRVLVKEYFSVTRGLDSQDVIDFISDNWKAICDIRLLSVKISNMRSMDIMLAIAEFEGRQWANENSPDGELCSTWADNYAFARDRCYNGLKTKIDSEQ
jgi:hypothetical protein